MREEVPVFIWLRQAIRRLTGSGGEGNREAEYLGYEAFFTAPGIRPPGVPREGRPAAVRKPLPGRKAA